MAPALDREEAFAPGGALQLEAALASAPVVGDTVLLERLAENLIENAVRYNAAVGWVRVRTGIERGEAVLHVANPGARTCYERYGFVATGGLEPLRPGSAQRIELMEIRR